MKSFFRITLFVEVSAESFRANDLKPTSAYKRGDANVTALTDTGCQAVCMGMTQLHSLGLSVTDLLTLALNFKAANSTGINILGAVYIYIHCVDNCGRVWGTNQLCYVAEDVNQLVLSRDACEILGMIPPSFPAVGSYGWTDSGT